MQTLVIILSYAAAILVALAGLVVARPRPRFGNFLRRFGKAFLDEPDATYLNTWFVVTRRRYAMISGTMPEARLFAVTIYTPRKQVVGELTDQTLGVAPGQLYRIAVTATDLHLPGTHVIRARGGVYLAVVRIYLAKGDLPTPTIRYQRPLS